MSKKQNNCGYPGARVVPRAQEVVKSAETGQYVEAGLADPKTTYETTEEHLTPWQKEYRRLGRCLESETDNLQRYVWLHAINVHCAQELRP